MQKLTLRTERHLLLAIAGVSDRANRWWKRWGVARCQACAGPEFSSPHGWKTLWTVKESSSLSTLNKICHSVGNIKMSTLRASRKWSIFTQNPNYLTINVFCTPSKFSLALWEMQVRCESNFVLVVGKEWNMILISTLIK